MAVYRFRIVFEDQEDFCREIDILGKQSYHDFHLAILKAIEFDSKKEASFFMSDDFWRKGQELALNPGPIEEDEDDYPNPNKKKDVRAMSSSKIAEYIEDPHQKMVYVYDPSEKWTLMIELLKIVPLDSTANYPMLSKSEGTAPKQYKQNIVAPVVDEDEEDEVDSNIKEKIFSADEGIDEMDHLGDSEEGEDAPSDSEEAEPTDESGGDDAGDDFEQEAYGDDSEEQ